MTSPTESNTKETTDSAIQNGQSVQIDLSTIQFLRRRAQNNERTVDDVINRLLKETANEVELQEVIQTAFEQFEHIACVTVAHLATYEEPTQLRISIHTGDVDGFEEYVDLYESRSLVHIERGNEEDDLKVPFDVIATCDGPQTLNSQEMTTIFMQDSVIGSEEIELVTGLDYLHDKLSNPDGWELTNSFSVNEIRSHS